MSIQFIYFDLGRVLLDFTYQRGFDQIATAGNVSADRVREILIDEGLGQRCERGELSTAELHQEFCKSANTSIAMEDLNHAWSDIFEIMPQSVRLAASLRAAGYPLGILSNTCAAHWQFAVSRYTILSQLFSIVVTSYEVQSMKPDAVIYQVAAERAGVAPSQIFFTDDRAENVASARDQGWNAAQFHDATRLANELEAFGVAFAR